MYAENTANLSPLALNAVWGTSNTDVFVVGTSGSVVHWNGAWSQQTTPANYVLNAIAGSSSTVYAVGRTTVGMAPAMLHYVGSWTDATPNLPAGLPAQMNLHGVWTNTSNAFAVGDFGTIIHSTNQGATWSTMPSNTPNILNAVSGIGVDLFAVGYGGVVLRYRIP